LGSSLQTCARSVLELDALGRNSLVGIRSGRDFASASRVSLARPGFRRRFRPSSRPSAFLRELFKGTKASPTCQGGNLIPTRSVQTQARIRTSTQLSLGAPAPDSGTWESTKLADFPQLAQRKYQRATGKMPAPASANAQKLKASGSCNGLFSLGNPYRGLRGVHDNSPSPTNRLPTSLNPYVDRGRPLIPRAFARRATGRLHCHTYSFIRVTQASARCKTEAAQLNPLFSAHDEGPDLRPAWIGSLRLWKAPHLCGNLPPCPRISSTHSETKEFHSDDTAAGPPRLNSPRIASLTHCHSG
jgi:hypothetical protein